MTRRTLSVERLAPADLRCRCLLPHVTCLLCTLGRCCARARANGFASNGPGGLVVVMLGLWPDHPEPPRRPAINVAEPSGKSGAEAIVVIAGATTATVAAIAAAVA